MKPMGWTLVVLMLLMNSCSGQSAKSDQKEQVAQPEPQTEIRVNREYDEDGNLIRYDSTYASYYTTIGDNQRLKDSLFFDFRSKLDKQYPFFNRTFMDDLFFEDSLLKYDFYKRDFFSERFRRNMQRLDDLFIEMDSIKNQYFIRPFPEFDEME